MRITTYVGRTGIKTKKGRLSGDLFYYGSVFVLLFYFSNYCFKSSAVVQS